MVRETEVVTLIYVYLRTYMRAAIGSCDDEYGALLNGNRSGGLRLVLYTKDHARAKMRPLYVKIMVYRPFSLAVGRPRLSLSRSKSYA